MTGPDDDAGGDGSDREPTDEDATDPDAADLDALVRTLHAELRATEELALDPAANRWLGEAQAVAGDLVGADLPPERVRERAGDVERLLAEVDGTGHPAADDHVETARDLAAAISGTG